MLVGRRSLIACRTRPRSLVSLATIRAVRSAAITLTTPPVGSSLSASIAADLAPFEPVRQDVGRAHARGRVDDEDDVARQPGGALEERPRGEQHEDQDEQELEQQQEAPPEPLPRRVRLDVREQAGPQQRGRHDRLVAPQLEHVHRDDRGDEQQPEQREGVEQRHSGLPEDPAPAELGEHQLGEVRVG